MACRWSGSCFSLQVEQGRGFRAATLKADSDILCLSSSPNLESMKRCFKCGQEKIFKEFSRHPRRGDGLQSQCKSCQKAYKDIHYRENKNEYLAKNKRRKKSNAIFINSQKQGPCMDCGETYPPWVMDFDHRDGKKKKFSISEANTVSKETIIKEIEKCDLVCANCHRQRTHDRMVQSANG
jgi:hypothetical protein